MSGVESTAAARAEGSARGRSRSLALTALLLAPLPLLFLFGAGKVRDAVGPLHVGLNADPSYVYLMNGLALAEGAAPRHVDHPGTPLQALVAVYLRFQGCSATGSCLEPIVRAAESHLSRLVSAVDGALAAALWLGALLVALRTGDLASGWLFQAGPLLGAVAFTEAPFLKPEPFLFVLGLPFVALLLHETASGGRQGRAGSAALGLLGALLCATKITALPLALLGLVSRRSRAACLAWTAGFVPTALVALWPMLEDRGRTLEFFAAFVRFRGSYGTEEGGPPSPVDFLSGIATLLAAEPFVALVLFGSIAAIVLTRRSAGEGARLDRRLLALAVAAELLQLLLAGRQPRARYLVPALILLGLNLVLLRRLFPGPFHRGARIAVAVGAAAIFAFQATKLARSCREIAFQQVAATRAEAEIAGVPAAQIVDGYGSSSPAYAIWLGANYFDGRWGRELAALFPGFLALDPWKLRLVGFDRGDPAIAASAAATRTRLRVRAPVKPASQRQLAEAVSAVGLALARPGELAPAARSCRGECVFELAPASAASRAAP